jgi:hypothetical protein
MVGLCIWIRVEIVEQHPEQDFIKNFYNTTLGRRLDKIAYGKYTITQASKKGIFA